jgi:dolichol-phosphate mannosyltransferase
MSQLSIIVPTYKEAINIPILVKEISTVMENDLIHEWELIIVDDDSNDGTVEICQKLLNGGAPIKIIVRKNKTGLSTAVLEGFMKAIGDIFIVMDADLSHPPSSIPPLYNSIIKGNEFAIGSRYIPGGSTDDKWTVYRYINSKVASLLARPLVNISDPMSGFFALPRTVWERGRNKLTPVGYKIGLELIIKCRPNTIKEIPIHFRTRKFGKSKLSFKQQLLYLCHVVSLYIYCLRFK